MFYTVHWKSHADADAGKVEIEADNEEQAKAKAWKHIETHYEDELRDLGIEITTVTADKKKSSDK